LSLGLGSPEGGRKLRAESATLWVRLSVPLHDLRKIPTFVAGISQTTWNAWVIFLINKGKEGSPNAEPQRQIMSSDDHAPVLHPTRTDLSPEIRMDVLTLLNQPLASPVDLRSQVKQACWNVKGKDFIPLPALFTTLAAAFDVYADLVAERIAILGGVQNR